MQYVVIAFVVLILVGAALGLKIVNQAEVMLIERLGKFLLRHGHHRPPGMHARDRHLLGRGKSKQAVVTAVGRELLGFMWAIGVTIEAAEGQAFPVAT